VQIVYQSHIARPCQVYRKVDLPHHLRQRLRGTIWDPSKPVPAVSRTPKLEKAQARVRTVSGEHRPDSATDRVLGLLDLFTEQQPVWTAEVLIERQQVARATMYRYLRALTETGFLSPLGGGAYALGPRVIQMDRLIRMIDPLLQHGPPVMEAIRDEVAGAQLLCRYYGLSVVSVHQDKTDARIKSSFDRGRPFSLFQGAPAKAILAHLGTQELQRLFLHHSREIAEVGLAGSWAELKDAMKAIEQRGYAVASDIDKTLVGIAAPIFVAPGEVTASLCLVRLRAEVSDEDIDTLGALVVKSAGDITRRVQRPIDIPRPAASRRAASARR